MSDILLVGLADSEGHAIELLLNRRWPNLRTHTIQRSAKLEIPRQDTHARNCKVCVVDLGSIGLRNRCDQSEAALAAFLDGRPAILLSRDTGSGWLNGTTTFTSDPLTLVIKTPYTSTQLLDGITKTLEAKRMPVVNPPASGSRADAPLAPAWRRALDLAEQLNRQTTSGTASKTFKPAGNAPIGTDRQVDDKKRHFASDASGTQTIPRGMGLRNGALPVLFGVFPVLRELPVVALGERILAADQAVLLHLNKDVMFVVNARKGWLTSGISFQWLLKMLCTSNLLDQATIQPLGDAEAEVMLRERFGDVRDRMRYPMDTLVWELMAAQLERLSLRRQGGLRMRLKRLPNFTRLQAMSPLDLQMAVACAHSPYSIDQMAQKYPGQEQLVYRFFVMSLLSGIGEIVSETLLPAKPSQMRMPDQDERRRGFFRSLLDRLF